MSENSAGTWRALQREAATQRRMKVRAMMMLATRQQEAAAQPSFGEPELGQLMRNLPPGVVVLMRRDPDDEIPILPEPPHGRH